MFLALSCVSVPGFDLAMVRFADDPSYPFFLVLMPLVCSPCAALNMAESGLFFRFPLLFHLEVNSYVIGPAIQASEFFSVIGPVAYITGAALVELQPSIAIRACSAAITCSQLLFLFSAVESLEVVVFLGFAVMPAVGILIPTVVFHATHSRLIERGREPFISEVVFGHRWLTYVLKSWSMASNAACVSSVQLSTFMKSLNTSLHVASLAMLI